MSTTNRLSPDERGTMNVLLIPLILSVILFLVAAGFGMWAYMGRQDYKNNVDQHVAKAVQVAIKETETKKDNEFAVQEKQPLKTYQGPEQYGSLIVKFPKTWSAYVDDSGKSGSLVNGYFYPNSVPGTNNGTSYALRVEVVQSSFASVVAGFDQYVKSGKIKSTAYAPVNVKNIVGVRLDGEIQPKQQGIMVIIPLRDKTIKIYTQSDQYFDDFNNNILPNLSFTP